MEQKKQPKQPKGKGPVKPKSQLDKLLDNTKQNKQLLDGIVLVRLLGGDWLAFPANMSLEDVAKAVAQLCPGLTDAIDFGGVAKLFLVTDKQYLPTPPQISVEGGWLYSYTPLAMLRKELPLMAASCDTAGFKGLIILTQKGDEVDTERGKHQLLNAMLDHLEAVAYWEDTGAVLDKLSASSNGAKAKKCWVVPKDPELLSFGEPTSMDIERVEQEEFLDRILKK